MSKYCITAANHRNPGNHVASSFNLWEYNPLSSTWRPLGGKSIQYVTELLVQGHEVLSARELETTISVGAPIEIELRISNNESYYKISSMPTF